MKDIEQQTTEDQDRRQKAEDKDRRQKEKEDRETERRHTKYQHEMYAPPKYSRNGPNQRQGDRGFRICNIFQFTRFPEVDEEDLPECLAQQDR